MKSMAHLLLHRLCLQGPLCVSKIKACPDMKRGARPGPGQAPLKTSCPSVRLEIPGFLVAKGVAARVRTRRRGGTAWSLGVVLRGSLSS